MARKPKNKRQRKWAPTRVGAGPSAADIHAQFQAQIMQMLDDSDMSEEEKQRILVTMQCPCCGGTGASLTVKM